MDKYAEMLQQSIDQQVSDWNSRGGVTERDMYQFFHRLKGTAATVGLTDWEDHLKQSLRILDEESDQVLREEERRDYLAPFVLSDPVTDVTPFKNAALWKDASENAVILVIHENPDDAVWLRGILELSGKEVVMALSMKRALDMSYKMMPSLIIADYATVHSSAEDQNPRKNLMERAIRDFIPVIYTTADFTPKEAQTAYYEGVIDYLDETLFTEMMPAILDNRIQFSQKVNQALIMDELTGVYNRRYMNKRLKELTEGHRRTADRGWTFVLMDLDHFKKVNDTFGHATGDEVLKVFAAMSKQAAENCGEVFRYGGEEFAMIIHSGSSDVVAGVINAVREALSHHVFKADGVSFTVTFSSGVYRLDHEEPAHLKSVIESADQALYQAKNSGRNRTLFFEDLDFSNLQFKEIRLLIVDDDPAVCSLIKDNVSGWDRLAGYPLHVYDYQTGRGFLQRDWYREGDLYFILLDGNLPDTDGVEILEELRASYQSDSMVIVMITARSAEHEVMHALNKGADDYVTKPFSIGELTARIERISERVFTT
ncbi:diguanylate cyclase [Salisediminibacterium beveridgei]|uniref:Putative diguanylate cyclase (GGDEF domain) n=1 Tax=Salisediminibacterium beveridgei TaxID=632773 RepID=A0A1D7QS18_9BACI|nr:diguanylate cyclase [Salisediminibacterium beveridgei]AOM81807.1 putative diguanylate cyclase (GGDEF domain) [Salisediminibacterium beveridgei]